MYASELFQLNEVDYLLMDPNQETPQCSLCYGPAWSWVGNELISEFRESSL